MKLASYKDGSRDGQLVVVSRDLTMAAYASHIVNRLQPVLDDWNYLSPQLQDVFDALNAGRARHAVAFDPSQCMAPLPRAYQRVSSNAFRQDEPVELELRQRHSDELHGPCDPIAHFSEQIGLDFSAEIAVVTGDIPMGCPSDRAIDGVRLLMLCNDMALRNVAPGGSAGPAAFSPVAVTPDELGEAWAKGRVQLPLQTTWNGRKVGMCDAGVNMGSHFGQLIAALSQTRRVRAGSIICSGTVRNQAVEKKGQREWPKGFNSIADKRAMETHQNGAAMSNYMKAGDTIRMEMKGLDGVSVFGAIEQEVKTTASDRSSAAE